MGRRKLTKAGYFKTSRTQWEDDKLSTQIGLWYRESSDLKVPYMRIGNEARAVLSGAKLGSDTFPVPHINFFKAYYNRFVANYTSSSVDITVLARENDIALPQLDAEALSLEIRKAIRTSLKLSNTKLLNKRVAIDVCTYGNTYMGLIGEWGDDFDKLPYIAHLYFPDSFPDFAADPVNIETSRFFFHRSYMDRKIVAELFNLDENEILLATEREGHGIYGQDGRHYDSMPIMSISGGRASELNLNYGATRVQDIDMARNNLCEFFTGFVKDGGSPSGWLQVMFVNPVDPIICKREPYRYPFLPIVQVTQQEVPGNVLGYGIWNDVRDVHNWKNWQLWRISRKLAFLTDPTPLVKVSELVDNSNPDSPVAKDGWQLIPGEPLVYNDTPPAYMSMPPMDTETYMVSDRVTAELEKALGVNDLTMGQTKKGDQRTATEAQSLVDQSELVLSTMLPSYQQAMIDIGQKLGMMVAIANGIETSKALFVTDFDAALTSDQPSERMRELGSLQKLLMVVAQLKQAASMDIEATKEAGRISGNSNLVERFITKQPEAAAPTPGMEQMAPQPQAAPELSPDMLAAMQPQQ